MYGFILHLFPVHSLNPVKLWNKHFSPQMFPLEYKETFCRPNCSLFSHFCNSKLIWDISGGKCTMGQMHFYFGSRKFLTAQGTVNFGKRSFIYSFSLSLRVLMERKPSEVYTSFWTFRCWLSECCGEREKEREDLIHSMLVEEIPLGKKLNCGKQP